MKRLYLIGIVALASVVVGGIFAAREVAQSSNTVGPSAGVSAAPFGELPPDQDPSFSVADSGPTGLYPADIFNLGPIVSIACPALGLGCPGTVPEDDVDALSYGVDFTWPMKPYWKWLFFSVAPGSTGVAGSGVNAEANCPSPEPEADEFWSSAQAQFATNGQYYDGDGIDCNSGLAIPGIGLTETAATVPASDDLDALDEFPGPVIDHSGDGVPDLTFYSLDPTSPSLGLVAGGSPDDIFVSLVNVAGPLLYADGVANLGLQSGDDIDALCVQDSDDAYSGGEPLWFSLTASSPTVTGSAGAISASDILAPNPAGGVPVVVVQETAIGLNPTGDDLNALKCAQIGEEADKAVTGVEFDDASGYGQGGEEGDPLPEHPEKPGLQYVEVPADEQVVISVTSIEENGGPGEPADSLVAFYADIPLGCEGRWYDDDGFFPSDFYTAHGVPFAEPFSPEQLGQEDPEPLAKKPGDDDDLAQTFEVDLHFQTADYGITEPVQTGRRITRFFDLGCPEPGQYHFHFCNKVEPKDMIDPDIENNVWCSEMVVESVPPPEPHYACYAEFPGTLDPPTDVSLTTQFGTEDPVDVQLGNWICNPAIKTRAGGEPEGTTEGTHFRGFNISAPPLPDPPPVVNLSDQFGLWEEVTVEEPFELLTPAIKTIDPDPLPPEDPPEDPHYKCYSLPELGTGTEVVLVQDQFYPTGADWTVDVDPSVLCLPADKNGEVVPDASHLLCHSASTPPVAEFVNVRTQFGDELMLEQFFPEGYLCAPAEKEVVGEAQDPSLSLHEGSPTLGIIAGVYGPPTEADVLDANAPSAPTQGIPCGPAGLGLGLPACAGPGTDELNSMSYGVDFTLAAADGLHWLYFSVAPGSQGAAATAVFGEHSCIGNYPSGGAEPEADVFGTKALGSNIQNLDGDGAACNGNAAPSVGLQEPAGDDLDALDEQPVSYVDSDPPGGDGNPDAPVYFSLDSASPSIPALLAGPGGAPSVEDVFVCDPTGAVFAPCPLNPPSVYADGVAQLGLAPDDEIDALCLLESGDGEYVLGQDQLYFSLSPGSPSVTGGAYSAADVLEPSPVGAPNVVAASGTIGLTASDDVNAMKCFQKLVTTDDDADTLPDEYEGQHACLQLGVDDANVDWEPDGIIGDPLTNLEEYGIGTDPCVVDTDSDGCADGEELGPDPLLGGGRDPLNPYDFYDITDISFVIGSKDQAVTVFDLQTLLTWGGACTGCGPNPNGKDYDADGNSNTIKDGAEMDFAGLAGFATGPDGAITVFDLQQLLNEGGADCQAAPN